MDRFKLTETFSLKDPICATFFERDDIKTLIWPTTGMAVKLHNEIFMVRLRLGERLTICASLSMMRLVKSMVYAPDEN